MSEVLEGTREVWYTTRWDRDQVISIPRHWFGMGVGDEKAVLKVQVFGTVEIAHRNPKGATFGVLKERVEYGLVNFWGHSLLVTREVPTRWIARRPSPSVLNKLIGG